MGSIQNIYSPEKWIKVLEGKNKNYKNDLVYEMVIGTCDDELSTSEISVLISKENYERILNGTYSIETKPYSMQKIILHDKEENIIPLVKGKLLKLNNNVK